MNELIITVPVDEVLDILGHGDNWTQGAWTDDDGRMCLHGGIRQCEQQPGDAHLIQYVAERQGWGTRWNDAPGRTWNDIKEALTQHREVLPGELAAAFGPQWEPIVALVRRAAVLTPYEAQQLDAAWYAASEAARAAAGSAAWYAASYAAWYAASYAAGSAASDAAWYAARYAASDAAGSAAWYAARVAALGLATRHLIDQHGYTQHHYDTLTAPWAAVIGHAHPDDAVTTELRDRSES
jgi:hypothetical protein